MKPPLDVVCPACKNRTAMRINRNGFLQRRVLGLFGIYPWKCGSCGTAFLYRKRGQRHASRPSVS
jgi:transposase-like protein